MKPNRHTIFKQLLLFVILFTASLTFAQQKFNPALKKQLDSIDNLDQQYRGILSDLMTPSRADSTAKMLHLSVDEANKHYWKLQNHIDSANVLLITAIIKKYGYPGKALVGEESSSVAWIVIQHSPKIAQYLPLIKKAAETKQLAFKYYAMMLDRDLMNKDKEQIYGTQATARTLKKTGQNAWFIWPIKDPANVNKRRKQAGFPDTVEQYAKSFDLTYKVVRLDELILK